MKLVKHFCVLSIIFLSHVVPETYRPRKYIDLDDERLYNSLSSIKLGDSMHEFFRDGLPSLYDDSDSITVIMTQYKRNYTEMQLNLILQQEGVKISQIFIQQNENHVNLSFLNQLIENLHYPHLPPIKWIHNRDENFKFYGRFALPLVIDTTYTIILDDDIGHGSRFFAHCLNIVDKYNAICGHAGEIITPTFAALYFAPMEVSTRVDYLIQTFVFRTEWIRYFWRESMPTFSQAEDISFSLTLFKNAGITAIIASSPERELGLWGSLPEHDRGSDQHSTMKKKSSSILRWSITLYWIEAGYLPLALRSTLQPNFVNDGLYDGLNFLRSNRDIPSEDSLRRELDEFGPHQLLKNYIKVPPKDSTSFGYHIYRRSNIL